MYPELVGVGHGDNGHMIMIRSFCEKARRHRCANFFFYLSILITPSSSVLSGDAIPDQMRGPWEEKGNVQGLSVVESQEREGGFTSDISFGWLHIYQNYMGVVVRSKCPMHPSCSNYSIEAIEKHGAAIGCLLTCDRLFHEADEKLRGRRIVVDGQLKALDRVADNDYWWREVNFDENR